MIWHCLGLWNITNPKILSTPSMRNIISIKPPPMYTKKPIPNNNIPPPPPRPIPIKKSEMGNISNNKRHTPPIRRANSFKVDQNNNNNNINKLEMDIQLIPAPHKCALPPAGNITPKNVQRLTYNNNNNNTHSLPQLHSFPNTAPVFTNNNSNSNSYSHNTNTNKIKPGTPTPTYNHKRQARDHARTMTATTFDTHMSKWNNKPTSLNTAKFGKYKNKLAKKYSKNKNKLKSKYKEKKSVIKEYRKKRKESNMDIHNDNEESYEYSISHTVDSISIMANPLSPHKIDTNNVDVKFDYDDDIKQEPDAPEYYTLIQIVELVTEPKVRGTQDQTVLLHTYCLYSSRQELYNPTKYNIIYLDNGRIKRLPSEALSLIDMHEYNDDPLFWNNNIHYKNSCCDSIYSNDGSIDFLTDLNDIFHRKYNKKWIDELCNNDFINGNGHWDGLDIENNHISLVPKLIFLNGDFLNTNEANYIFNLVVDGIQTLIQSYDIKREMI